MGRGLPIRLSQPEKQYLRRGLSFVLYATLGVGALWLSPWSPEAIDRPATLLAWGFPNLALRGYEDLGHGLAAQSTRAEALWRGGNLAATDLDDPQRAIVLLRELVSRYPKSPRAADANARLATLYALRQRDIVRAAESWQAAAEGAPERPEASQWWLEAGLSWQRAGQGGRAETALRRAVAAPDTAIDAWIALGQLLLSTDPEASYLAFESALKSGAQASTASLAKLGMATALERQDDRERAIAVLEVAIEEGDHDESLLRRRNRLRSRTNP